MYGRTPRILQQPDHVIGTAHLKDETGPEGARLVHRTQEVALAACIESMPAARLKLPTLSRTPLSAGQLDLTVGDQVEFDRKPANKDRPGRVGPAVVSVISQMHEHGKVTARWQPRHVHVP